MQTTLRSLHGFMMNGAGLRHVMEALEPPLSGVISFAYPDAPHAGSEESVARLASMTAGFRAKPPNLEWWNATDDGLTYSGWEPTRDALRAAAVQPQAAGHPVGLLGFSQGAAVAAALAALSERGSVSSEGGDRQAAVATCEQPKWLRVVSARLRVLPARLPAAARLLQPPSPQPLQGRQDDERSDIRRRGRTQDLLPLLATERPTAGRDDLGARFQLA